MKRVINYDLICVIINYSGLTCIRVLINRANRFNGTEWNRRRHLNWRHFRGVMLERGLEVRVCACVCVRCCNLVMEGMSQSRLQYTLQN